ncbi:ABC transporter substrate-binding protein [Natronosalvus rutilus]|uniref:ABC transporter substrate-binding protein n=1 Tax=Natronosalvus rutilus TaxID=2953753 RepID=A0A9E7SZ73_9EURY|nr:ABC transporter substrate-binding protein [Natronosalvus rutilus]UTF55708.1 ABC transporter substrate-binding protein [Natronosalvus rutilus]
MVSQDSTVSSSQENGCGAISNGRRNFLRLTAGAGLTTGTTMLAGCFSGGDGGNGEDGDGGNGDDDTGGSGGNGDVHGGTLNVGLSVGVTSPLHPALASDQSSAQMLNHVGDNLTRVTPDLEVVPELVEEIPEPPDAQTWTFKLREGVMFHPPIDREMTAQDVVDTYHFIYDPELVGYSSDDYTTTGAWPFPGLLWGDGIDPMETIQATGEYEVTFDLAAPAAHFPALLGIADQKIFPLESLDELGDDLASPSTGYVGTGPFMWADGSSGGPYRLERFDDYWAEGEHGQLPYVDAIEYTIVPEAGTRRTQLEVGDIHISDLVPPRDISALEGVDSVETIVSGGGGHINQWVNLRYKDEFSLFEAMPGTPGEDEISESGKAVRQALRYATNHEAIVNVQFDGMASPRWGPLPPHDKFYDEDAVNTYPYDPEQAQQMLEDAGIETPWELDLRCTNESRFVDAAEIVQQSASDAGIDYEVRPLEKAASWGGIINSDAAWEAGGVSDEIDEGYETHIESIGDSVEAGAYFNAYEGGSGTNYKYIDVPELNELLNDARTTTDQEARQEAYSEAQSLASDLAPNNGLVWPDVTQAIRTEVKNFVPANATFRFRLNEVWLDQ